MPHAVRKLSFFADRVRAVVLAIPAGETLSYGEVARRVGSPGGARAVGQVLKRNFDPAVPCHRVIRADGSLGGYNRGVARKASLLRNEKDRARRS
jgi:O-6-methylguanine DNA methyltransferase